MGKFVKGCLIASGIMIFVGAICIAASAATGGLWQTEAMIANGELSFDSRDLGVALGDYDEMMNSFKSNVLGDEISAAEIRKLDIDIEGGSLILQTTDSDFFAVEESGSRYGKVRVSGDTLYVEKEYLAKSLWKNNGNDVMILSVPAECQLASVDIDLGAGQIELDDFVIKGEMEIDLGAGEVLGNQVKADRLTVNVGAGEAIFEESSVKDMEVNVGMGNMEYAGEIAGDLKADCSMGSIIFELTDSEQNHNYNMNCAMGSIELEDKSYSGMASGVYLDNDADSEFTVDCAMGSIEIYFKE
ncbi:MAG: DUF4097 family beta strand repeat protein [Lachnospiraceae bacterium]|nr:DUF4097 family beta strand repeat protein [Lachnospiraceae bacterium]